jgi:hypothetical protein
MLAHTRAQKGIIVGLTGEQGVIALIQAQRVSKPMIAQED